MYWADSGHYIISVSSVPFCHPSSAQCVVCSPPRVWSPSVTLCLTPFAHTCLRPPWPPYCCLCVRICLLWLSWWNRVIWDIFLTLNLFRFIVKVSFIWFYGFVFDMTDLAFPLEKFLWGVVGRAGRREQGRGTDRPPSAWEWGCRCCHHWPWRRWLWWEWQCGRQSPSESPITNLWAPGNGHGPGLELPPLSSPGHSSHRQPCNLTCTLLSSGLAFPCHTELLSRFLNSHRPFLPEFCKFDFLHLEPSSP